MTHQKTIKEINKKLSELNQRFEKLSSSDEIHLIDVDILLGMMREIYEKTSSLKEPEIRNKMEAYPTTAPYAPSIPANQDYQPKSIPEFTPPSAPSIPTHEVSPGMEHSEEAVPNEKIADFSQISYSNEPSQPEIRKPEPENAPPQQETTQSRPEVVQPQPKIIKQETEIVQPKVEHPFSEQEVAQPSTPEPVETPAVPSPTNYPPKPDAQQPDLFGNGSLSDKYKTEAPSLNDKVTTGKTDQTLADKINLVPISDIKSAIGINEKFQFINELFDGSSQQYNEAIALLNNCTGAETAHALFRNFQMRYKWDNENKVFLKFREYMERRYLNL